MIKSFPDPATPHGRIELIKRGVDEVTIGRIFNTINRRELVEVDWEQLDSHWAEQ